MKPNYKNELDFVLIKKHRVMQESKRIAEELKDVTARAEALTVLAGNPYDAIETNMKFHNLKLEIEGKINFTFKGTGGYVKTWGLYINMDQVERLMRENFQYTEEDLETYAGILIDLLEWSERLDQRIPEWLFFLRVHCNDDIPTFIEYLKTEFGAE